MAISELCQGDIFQIKGKLWEVVSCSENTLRVKSENGEISSIGINSKVIVTKI